MTASSPKLSTIVLLVVFIIALTIFANAYHSLDSTQQLASLYLVKVLLAALTVAFLIAFQLRWIITKYDLSVLDFYTKWKFFRQSLAIGTGIFLLSIAFMLDFGQYTGRFHGQDYTALTTTLEILALVFFGYSYYKLARLRGV
ncbi:hypothetical protein DRN67_03905 [Candidatus Micrarchaeota archaeon]|nr:MAG: hypothetical protein DRN67_03905 [Candidatus Micrarchaeota archaeon]